MDRRFLPPILVLILALTALLLFLLLRDRSHQGGSTGIDPRDHSHVNLRGDAVDAPHDDDVMAPPETTHPDRRRNADVPVGEPEAGEVDLIRVFSVAAEPVEDVRVALAGTSIGTTDRSGFVHMSELGHLAHSGASVEFSGEMFAGGALSLTLREAVIEDDAYVFYLGVSARIDVRVHRCDFVLGEGAVEVIGLSDAAVPEDESDEMLFQRAARSYPRMYNRIARIDGDQRPGRWVEKSSMPGEVSLYVPFAGDVVVTTTASSMIADVQPLYVLAGTRYSLDVYPQKKPVVSGLVVSTAGVSIPGVQVTVDCSSWFDADELIPAGGERPGWKVKSRGERPDEPAFVTVSDSTVTDDEGRFSLPMPFTGRVTAYSFIPGFRGAMASSTSPDRGRDASLRVVAEPATPVRMYVVDQHGKEVRNEVFQVFRTSFP